MYKPKEWLFEGLTDLGHITDRGIQDAFKKYNKKASITKSVTVHSLRHSFATHLLEDGVNVVHIKKLLGHTHIQSTTFYLHVANIELNIKSPLDTLHVSPKKKRGRKSKPLAVSEDLQ